jgi:hypothetical protein
VGSLQCYIGMVCSSGKVHCEGREGFDVLLFASIVASVVSAAMAFISFDLKENLDYRNMSQPDVRHLAEMALVVGPHPV